jgi:hypothetical protein
MNDLPIRAQSLLRLATRLCTAIDSPQWTPPTGREARDLARQLDTACDEVERLLWIVSPPSQEPPHA